MHVRNSRGIGHPAKVFFGCKPGAKTSVGHVTRGGRSTPINNQPQATSVGVMLMGMRLKQIHADWPQVSTPKEVSICSQAGHPHKQLAVQKTGTYKVRQACESVWGPTMSGCRKHVGPIIVFPDLGTGVKPPFSYDPNHE
ncbi:hypothetical protein O181_105927 [Austropuccinia psidii MF-1]|uniref:Uncharacterized protein n=1 Tax=Austropuccinia psidii MF-1 TaxID=1389203 RepID=A0A9Q3PMU9_9BASI|nr:hypothetical protein [Austropuccinia psidii MF-1]